MTIHHSASRIAGHVLVEALIAQGVRHLLRRARRELPGGARRLPRAPRAHPLHRLPAGGRRRLHGRGAGQAERPAGHLLRDARARAPPTPASALHTAFQDSTPMILFVGQVASDQRDREAFQELDYRQMFGPGTLGMAKWVGEVHSADRLPEYVARAFHTAMQGRPGPVVLVLPEDMLTTPTAAPVLPRVEPAQAWPAPGALRDLRALLLAAQRPFVIAGGSGWDAEGCARAAALCRELAAAGGLRLPLPGHLRQPPSAVRRRRRHRHQPEAGGAHPRGRPGDRAGRAPGRDDDRRLHAAARRRGRRRSWSTSTPVPRNWAASTPPTCCCRPRWPAPPRRWRRWPRRRSCPGAPGPTAAARRLRGQPRAAAGRAAGHGAR